MKLHELLAPAQKDSLLKLKSSLRQNPAFIAEEKAKLEKRIEQEKELEKLCLEANVDFNQRMQK